MLCYSVVLQCCVTVLCYSVVLKCCVHVVFVSSAVSHHCSCFSAAEDQSAEAFQTLLFTAVDRTL